MNFNMLVKSQDDYKNLVKEVEKKALGKSTLIFSSDRVYSKQFALCLASAILEGGDCDGVHAQKVGLNAHPDVKVYPKGDKFVVADSQDIVDECFIKPIFADKKIFIINDIDDAMEISQNKLLKVLEEPPTGVFFILTADNQNLVLPTIKSRCNKVELKKLSAQTISKVMMAYENGDLLALMCDGNVGEAIELAKKGDGKEIFDIALSLVTQMTSSKTLLMYSKKVLGLKDDALKVLKIFTFLLEDLLYLKVGNVKDVRFPLAKDALLRVIDEYSVRCICEIRKLVDNALKEISFNGNITLIVENLLLSVLEVKYICK